MFSSFRGVFKQRMFNSVLLETVNLLFHVVISSEASVECYTNVRGDDYRGYQFYTKRGILCQNWTSDYPHVRHYTPELFPNSGLGDHNYCRNPHSSNDCGSMTAWCYTTDSRTRWGYCNIGRRQRSCRPNHNDKEPICPKDWVEYRSNCYLLQVQDKKNFLEAEKSCTVVGAHLTSDLGLEEHCLLALYTGDGDYWIGLTDEGSRDNLVWLDNMQEIDFEKWAPNEPSRSPNVTTGESVCVGMSGREGSWKTYPCTDSLGYICKLTKEKPILPPTHTVIQPTTTWYQRTNRQSTFTITQAVAVFTAEARDTNGSRYNIQVIVPSTLIAVIIISLGGFILIYAVIRLRHNTAQRKRPFSLELAQGNAARLNQYDSDSTNSDANSRETVESKRTPRQTKDYYAIPEDEASCEQSHRRVNGKFWIPYEDLKIHETIGEGHYGMVLKANWFRRVVAIKMLKETSQEEQRESLKRELSTMIDVTTRCTHPNVARLLGWSYFKGNHCIVMEHLSGGSLHDVLTSAITEHPRSQKTYPNDPEVKIQSVTQWDIFKFAVDVARGMEYLSDHNIIHRDLACRNVLLDHHRCCKVSDFGLARYVTGNGEYIVTNKQELPARWMAVESLMSSTFTTKSDVWSFGVLLWEMINNGRVPYSEEGILSHQLLTHLSQGVRLSIPSSTPPVLRNILTECWKCHPSERPTFKTLRIRLENGMKDHRSDDWDEL